MENKYLFILFYFNLFELYFYDLNVRKIILLFLIITPCQICEAVKSLI